MTEQRAHRSPAHISSMLNPVSLQNSPSVALLQIMRSSSILKNYAGADRVNTLIKTLRGLPIAHHVRTHDFLVV